MGCSAASFLTLLNMLCHTLLCAGEQVFWVGIQFGGYISQLIIFPGNPPPPPPPHPPPPPPPLAPPPPPVGIMPQLNFTATCLNLTAAMAANISNFQARWAALVIAKAPPSLQNCAATKPQGQQMNA